MILQVRKWRLMIRTIFLVVSGMLMLVFATPASYALQDDTPKPLVKPSQLFDKERPLADKYIYTSTAPDFDHLVTTQEFGKTYYWVPLAGYDNRLFLRSEDKNFLQTYYCDPAAITGTLGNQFYGKLTDMQSQLGADAAEKAFAAQGVTVDKEKAMVLLHGEQPSSYRPIVPVWGLLALLWVAALVGLFKIWLGRQGPRHRTAAAMGS